MNYSLSTSREMMLFIEPEPEATTERHDFAVLHQRSQTSSTTPGAWNGKLVIKVCLILSEQMKAVRGAHYLPDNNFCWLRARPVIEGGSKVVGWLRGCSGFGTVAPRGLTLVNEAEIF
jgi:hypothetical protein